MPILAILAPFVSWIFRVAVVKFVFLAGIFAVMALVIPVAVGLLAPYIGASSLDAAFAGVDAGVWWLLDYFALDYGIPLMISAVITRFLIRRLPVIG